MPAPHVVLWTSAPHIMSASPHWRRYESSILLDALVQMLPIQCPSRFWTVHIFYCPASLKVSLNGYFCFPATRCCQPSILEDFSFSCQTASLYSSKLLLLCSLLVASFSVVSSWILLLVESPFAPWCLLSMGVFQSLIWMGSSLLSHVSCHYTGILQWPANLSNHLDGNSHNVIETFLSLDWFFPFDYLFGDGMPSIVVSSFLHVFQCKLWSSVA